jgi:hypothetical protein
VTGGAGVIFLVSRGKFLFRIGETRHKSLKFLFIGKFASKSCSACKFL